MRGRNNLSLPELKLNYKHKGYLVYQAYTEVKVEG